MRALTIRILLVLFFACAVQAARPGDFEVIGPGGGGAMFHPTVSPHNENTVLVSCDMTGAYITHDGGHSWRMFNLRGTVRFFAFDPVKPKTLYAYVTGLWRSEDEGETWNLVYPRPASIKGIRMNSDHADESLVAEPDPMGRIDALAIDPADSKVLYAAASRESGSALYVSRDYGANWQRDGTLPEPPQHLWVDPHSARDSRLLYLAGAHAIVVKSSSGMRVLKVPGGEPVISSTAGFGTQGKPVIYVASEHHVALTRDGGETWERCLLPGEDAEFRAVATSARNPQTVYLSYDHLKKDGNSWSGVAKSSDAGRNWSLVWKEQKDAASNVHDAWITSRFGAGWAENPLMLGVAEQNPNLCYGTDLGRTMKTTDGGQNWNQVYSRQTSQGSWISAGLDVTTSYGIHFDPFNKDRQFITYTDIGLFRSEDGGKSWSSSTEGVPREWWNTTYWVEFDPQVKGRMWSASSYTHDLPRPKMWRHNSPHRYRGGICISEDGGRTWNRSSEGLPETATTHILLDPNSPKTQRTLYVAAFGRGVYKSSDGGKTWAAKNTGITQAEPFAWRLALSPDRTLYLVVARRSDDGSIGNPGDGALYKSMNGGEAWQRIPLPAGVNGPNGLAIDPKDPRRLYLAAWARDTSDNLHGEGGGIYLSNDGGKTWRNTLDRDQHVYDVTVDPRDPRVLYAAGFESSVWRSADRGEHWQRVAGFNFKWAHRVIVDPVNTSMIYVTTFGGSVWHGRVDGKPVLLDIASPALSPAMHGAR